MTDALQPMISSFVDDLIMALQLLRESNALLSVSTTIFISFEHPVKALPSIFMTEAGIVTVSSTEQLRNAHWLISVTELGILTDVNFEQSEKVSR